MVKKGIYDKKGSYSVKVLGNVKGWGDSIVMQFTNNPNYGKSYFGQDAKFAKKFLQGYKKRR